MWDHKEQSDNIQKPVQARTFTPQEIQFELMGGGLGG